MYLKSKKHRKGSFTSDGVHGTRKAKQEAMEVRVRRRLPWVTNIFHDLRKAFELLRATGINFSAAVLPVQANG